ncbi:unnamed protein product [Tilletia controversa]|uniref:Serine aminopeptidase S33 domain-containing protein n=3 Tax=Tilletia TaxID=13289 RepID=A0A8X7MT32_9BASI|nr:hypothetical protein CF336_g3898 [Tilletia laevis]KAE8198250.1 hypothetical protein CF328_g3606 [Tilletia controversa]KAE8261913.1 hypothetical protein A4X03_0g2867 [Tilletia caries]KAE8203383.1 hypothetical protein CF335_g3044 [Tilletia laevis]KAE8247585.1 hypothetical protein A4X06_0g4343 [Tilletia controversa]
MTSLSKFVWLNCLEPAFIRLGVAKAGSGDPTYGRVKIPYTALERRWIYENPRVKVTERRVSSGLIKKGTTNSAMRAEAAQNAGQALDADTWYNTWEIPEAIQKADLKSDVVIVHGMNDYGGKLGPFAMAYLEAGFRVIVYDFTGHGRSAGVHGYIPDMRALPQALHAVMRDVLKRDGEAAQGRKMFLTGTSMGGFTCLYYASLYPSQPETETEASQTDGQANGTQHVEIRMEADHYPNLAGVAVTAPMITIAPETKPSPTIHKIAKVLRLIAPRLPLVDAVKGNVSDDPRVDEEFFKDPLTYKGKVRIGTGLAIWDGINDLQRKAHLIKVPVALHHGSKDRATSAQGTIDFFPCIGSEKKTLKIWEGLEHIMQKYVEGMDDKDTAQTDAVIHELRDFFLEIAKGS